MKRKITFGRIEREHPVLSMLPMVHDDYEIALPFWMRWDEIDGWDSGWDNEWDSSLPTSTSVTSTGRVSEQSNSPTIVTTPTNEFQCNYSVNIIPKITWGTYSLQMITTILQSMVSSLDYALQWRWRILPLKQS